MFYNVTMPADWFLIQRLIVWSTLARVVKLVSLQPTDTFCQHRSVTPLYADCKLFSVFLSLNTFGDGTPGRFWPVSPGNLFRSSSAILTNLPACSVAGPEEASQIFWHAEKLSWKMIAICSLLNREVKRVEIIWPAFGGIQVSRMTQRLERLEKLSILYCATLSLRW